MAKRVSRTSPHEVRLYRAEVVRSERLSATFQRVTITGDDLAVFPWLGFDHWFRLFMPLPHQRELQLPELAGEKWWEPYLAIPEEVRPHCSNYTVADFRAADGELDIDFVIHRGEDGNLEGAAAIWACSARPGDPLALLDQGLIFDLPDDATEVLLVADETGLPGVAGILRSLPREIRGRVIQEVPTPSDRRPLVTPPGVDVTWVVRKDQRLVAGRAALAELQRQAAADARGYGFVVGESMLATGGRRHLRQIGLPKDRITFSGFWKHSTAKVG